jgi:hypothetical protein
VVLGVSFDFSMFTLVDCEPSFFSKGTLSWVSQEKRNKINKIKRLFIRGFRKLNLVPKLIKRRKRSMLVFQP